MRVKERDNDDRQDGGDRQYEECETPCAASPRTTRLRGLDRRLGRFRPFERGFYRARKPILDVVGWRQPGSQLRPCKLDICIRRDGGESYPDCRNPASDSTSHRTRAARLIRARTRQRGLDPREPE